ncbi:hypothetical protein E1301_Tti008326 [Triplophysa tibetana]|uniref:Uncharacterized protein n=1 Tax=Triplophysa tibetana TaxID=1572043 RepID=A0A5A9PH73_9TELE|nr:hypothetical protein E1301_Tti008326 [Triplophysa tibetana]
MFLLAFFRFLWCYEFACSSSTFDPSFHPCISDIPIPLGHPYIPTPEEQDGPSPLTFTSESTPNRPLTIHSSSRNPGKWPPDFDSASTSTESSASLLLLPNIIQYTPSASGQRPLLPDMASQMRLLEPSDAGSCKPTTLISATISTTSAKLKPTSDLTNLGVLIARLYLTVTIPPL